MNPPPPPPPPSSATSRNCSLSLSLSPLSTTCPQRPNGEPRLSGRRLELRSRSRAEPPGRGRASTNQRPSGAGLLELRPQPRRRGVADVPYRFAARKKKTNTNNNLVASSATFSVDIAADVIFYRKIDPQHDGRPLRNAQRHSIQPSPDPSKRDADTINAGKKKQQNKTKKKLGKQTRYQSVKGPPPARISRPQRTSKSSQNRCKQNKKLGKTGRASLAAHHICTSRKSQ